MLGWLQLKQYKHDLPTCFITDIVNWQDPIEVVINLERTRGVYCCFPIPVGTSGVSIKFKGGILNEDSQITITITID